MVKLLASYNEEVNAVVLDNAPQNAKYTSPQIQKEILDVMVSIIYIYIYIIYTHTRACSYSHYISLDLRCI